MTSRCQNQHNNYALMKNDIGPICSHVDSMFSIYNQSCIFSLDLFDFYARCDTIVICSVCALLQHQTDRIENQMNENQSHLEKRSRMNKKRILLSTQLASYDCTILFELLDLCKNLRLSFS